MNKKLEKLEKPSKKERTCVSTESQGRPWTKNFDFYSHNFKGDF